MAQWEEVRSGLEHGGYVAWEAAVDAALGFRDRDHVTLFVKLVPTGDMTLLQAIERTMVLKDIRLSRHERDLLATERTLVSAGSEAEVRLVAFWPRAKLGKIPDFWRVLRVGPGLAIPKAKGSDQGTDLATVAGDLDPALPLVAAIDDGIAFLNTRFRKSARTTRIRAVWLQAAERGAGTGDILCGRVVDASEIDRHLSRDRDESAQYRKINRELYLPTDSALTSRHAAHGTHVLDLAAGAAPWSGDPMSDLPILAVQLPPASIRETSGRRMETYLVQGLRWILSEVLRQAHYSDVPPVVVNISLGALSGPGDRHAFVADWLDHEVKRHARVTGNNRIRLVVAYGNARLARLVARDEVRRAAPMRLIWRIQPEDRTSSFLELRVPQTQVAGLKLRLSPPEGSGLLGTEIDWPAAGTGWRLPGPLAAISGSPEEGGQSHVLLALGPTAGTGAMPAIPSGAWQVTVETSMIEPVLVTARVQRDDTPPGYWPLGRQSWLDHPLAWDWDEELRSYIAPRRAEDAPGCPVTREGSCVAYAGVADPRILFVGAGRPVTGAPDRLRATVYSAEGVQHFARPGESLGPTLLAKGDDGIMLPGRRGSGVPSGSVVRMSGTSVAAPQLARAIARYFLATPGAGNLHADPDLLEANERLFLSGLPVWGKPHPRTGMANLVAPTGRDHGAEPQAAAAEQTPV